MNCLNRFNQREFSLRWTLWWLQAIFGTWAVTGLLGFFLDSKGLSEISNTLSNVFIYVVILTAVVQGALWLFRPVKSR